MYDIYARFFEKRTDTKPRYVVPLGTYSPTYFNYFESKGFSKDSESTAGYVDYIKRNVKEYELREFTKRDYADELQDVLNHERKCERIDISAMEFEELANYWREYEIGDYTVELRTTEYDSPVFFNFKGTRANIYLGALKMYFNVLTQQEVLERLKKCNWKDFHDLEKWIKDVKENASKNDCKNS